jgi:hypothetical protein
VGEAEGEADDVVGDGAAGGEVDVGATGRIGSGFASLQLASSNTPATVAATGPLTSSTLLGRVGKP